MRVVISYYPDAQDDADVQASVPSLMGSVPTFDDGLVALASMQRKVEREKEIKQRELTSLDF